MLLYERNSFDCELLQGEASAGVHPALPGCMVFALFWAVVWLVVGFGLISSCANCDIFSKAICHDGVVEFPEDFSACVVTRAMPRV